MAEILSSYGKDSSTPQVERATCGGVEKAKALPYDPPKGPTAHTQQGPGLHGTNHGHCGTQGKH